MQVGAANHNQTQVRSFTMFDCMQFTMTHPMVIGIVKVNITTNRHGTKFYTASTESGVLVKQMCFGKTLEEVKSAVYYGIGRRLGC
jgi:hypothetical protein